MTSGVYVLRFPSNKFYIGKADNTEVRFKQHIRKLQEGNAAKAMQAEFDAYGLPVIEKVFNVHSDHIDLVESILIQKYKDHNDCLNASQPRKISAVEAEILIECIEHLEVSTAEHLRRLGAIAILNKELKEDIKVLENTLTTLEEDGMVLPEDVEDELAFLDLSLNEYKQLCDKQAKELDEYKNMSLFKRIFNYRV